MNQDEMGEALRRLSESQRLAARLRSDYATIARSRFHALRVLWFSLKGMLGVSSPSDRYAAWSPGFIPPIASAAGVKRTAGASSPSAALAHEAPDLPSPQESRLLATWTTRIDSRPLSDKPLVSIVIPVYNEIAVTIRCLQSMADTWFEALAVQVILVDDGSSDRTASILTRLPTIDYVRNGSNQGFVRACNRGAALARGKYLCFLNNDTEVREAWLDYLVCTAESDATVGAVGSKLIYPDGKLQEAGAIIWRDASGWNYGRGENPADARYNFMRDVDYCSGAALLVRRDLFERLGGFSNDYAPAYYEDADLCFGVRSLGYRVLYQPRSEVIHFEGVTSGTDLSSGTKRYQEVNRPKFVGKWAAVLEGHFENAPARVPMAARRLRSGKTVLVVDSYVPLHDKDAGSKRLIQIVRLFRELGYSVIFLPDNYAPLQPYTRELQDMGVEVLHHTEKGLSLRQALDSVLPMLDYAWICRPNLFAKYAGLIRRNGATQVLYDTIDLHFLRARREAELLGLTDDAWKNVEREEIDAARSADATIVVIESERELLRERGIENVYVVPTLHDMEIDEPRSFAASSGLVFIGGYNHPPNVDAAKWLCREIMPRIWERDPAIRLHLLGSSPPEEVLALASDRVSVPGYVADVSAYFKEGRVFVAPLRFGAGIKGKVGHALSYGLPVVATGIAAEGFGFESGRDCLIANAANGFADAVWRLYSDEKLWTTISRESARVLKPFGTAAMKPQLARILETVHARSRATAPA